MKQGWHFWRIITWFSCNSRTPSGPSGPPIMRPVLSILCHLEVQFVFPFPVPSAQGLWWKRAVSLIQCRWASGRVSSGSLTFVIYSIYVCMSMMWLDPWVQNILSHDWNCVIHTFIRSYSTMACNMPPLRLTRLPEPCVVASMHSWLNIHFIHIFTTRYTP